MRFSMRTFSLSVEVDILRRCPSHQNIQVRINHKYWDLNIILSNLFSLAVYLLVLVEYPQTENFESGERVLEDFYNTMAVIPEKWRKLPGKLPVEYDPIPSEALCYFPSSDHYSTLEELQEILRNQADPQPDWYLLNSHVIRLYGKERAQIFAIFFQLILYSSLFLGGIYRYF